MTRAVSPRPICNNVPPDAGAPGAPNVASNVVVAAKAELINATAEKNKATRHFRVMSGEGRFIGTKSSPWVIKKLKNKVKTR